MRLAGAFSVLLAASSLAGCRVPDEPAPYDNGRYALTLGLTLAPATVTVSAGSTTSVVVAAARGGGLLGSIYLQAEGLPAEVTVSFSPHPLSGATTGSTMTIATTAVAPPGRYPLTVRASLGAYEAAAQLSLQIR